MQRTTMLRRRWIQPKHRANELLRMMVITVLAEINLKAGQSAISPLTN